MGLQVDLITVYSCFNRCWFWKPLLSVPRMLRKHWHSTADRLRTFYWDSQNLWRSPQMQVLLGTCLLPFPNLETCSLLRLRILFGTGESGVILLEGLSKVCEELSNELGQSWGCTSNKLSTSEVPQLSTAAEAALDNLLLRSSSHFEGVLAGNISRTTCSTIFVKFPYIQCMGKF